MFHLLVFVSPPAGEGPRPDRGHERWLQRVHVLRGGVLAKVGQHVDEEEQGRSACVAKYTRPMISVLI